MFDLLHWWKDVLAQTFNSSFRYIDDVLSLKNIWFGDYLHCIYPIGLDVKDNTDTEKSACYLDLHLEIDNRGGSKTKIYDKHDDFIFTIDNFPFISSNIPASPAYGVYISQLMGYSRDCAQYSDCIGRVKLLTQRLLKQGYVAHRLKWSLQTSTVINTKYSYLKLHWIFYLLRRFPLSQSRLLTNLFIYMSNPVGVL